MRNLMAVLMIGLAGASCVSLDEKETNESAKTNARSESSTDGDTAAGGAETLPDEANNATAGNMGSTINTASTINTGNVAEPDDRPYARLTPTEVDLGDVPVGDAVEVELTIESVGREPVTIVAVRVEGDRLSLETSDLDGTVLAAGESVDVVVALTAEEPRPLEGRLVVETDGGDGEHVATFVANSACLETDPFLVDFVDVAPGETAQQTVVLTNCSSVVEHVVDVQMGQRFRDDTAVFFLLDESFPRTLMPGESYDVLLEFRPYREDWEGGNIAFSDDEYRATSRLRGNWVE